MPKLVYDDAQPIEDLPDEILFDDSPEVVYALSLELPYDSFQLPVGVSEVKRCQLRRCKGEEAMDVILRIDYKGAPKLAAEVTNVSSEDLKLRRDLLTYFRPDHPLRKAPVKLDGGHSVILHLDNPFLKSRPPITLDIHTKEKSVVFQEVSVTGEFVTLLCPGETVTLSEGDQVCLGESELRLLSCRLSGPEDLL